MKFYISSAFLNTREIIEIAKAADELGYDGIGIPDHVVNLETLDTPYPYTKDGQRRWQPFTDWPDPWVLAGALAQVTTRLKFVNTVYIPAMRNPYSAAKAIGTAACLHLPIFCFLKPIARASAFVRAAKKAGKVALTQLFKTLQMGPS